MFRKTQGDPVELGERYRDTITGLEGTATARHEFLHGCERITLEVLKGATHDELDELTFDAPRLVRASDNEPVSHEERPGGTRPGAPRTGARL